MNVFVYTLGCRVNQCESEAIAKAFADAGHTILPDENNADLIIVNTCTVTSKAEQKARRVIRIYAGHCPTLVTGCYAQVNPEEIQNLSDNVYVIPLGRKHDLLKLPGYIETKTATSAEGNKAEDNKEESLKRILFSFCSEKPLNGSVFDYAASGFSYHCRSYLKVQDGCDNNCGFCRVHIARGLSTFLDADTAVERALEIEKNGYHEIVLTGVNLTMYDHKGNGLGGLLEKLLAKLGPDMRFRLSSLEPDHIDDRLLECLKDPRMQPYFHVPIQSAADKVIKRVNRHYDSNHLEYVISRLREIKDDPFLACDIITGLPAEGDEEFEITRSFLERHKFAQMHVFPFSPRPDTALYKAKDRVPENIRDQRAKVLRELSDKQNAEYCMRQVGKENEVILEDKTNGIWTGLTGNYIKVRVDNVPQDCLCGDILKIRLTSVDRGTAI